MFDAFEITVDERHEYVLSQSMLAYEIQMTTLPPGNKWRRNHSVMVLAKSMDEALAAVRAHLPDDPIVNQIVLRNRDMTTLICKGAGDA